MAGKPISQLTREEKKKKEEEERQERLRIEREKLENTLVPGETEGGEENTRKTGTIAIGGDVSRSEKH